MGKNKERKRARRNERLTRQGRANEARRVERARLASALHFVRNAPRDMAAAAGEIIEKKFPESKREAMISRFWEGTLTPAELAQKANAAEPRCTERPPGAPDDVACIFRAGHSVPCRFFGRIETSEDN